MVEGEHSRLAASVVDQLEAAPTPLLVSAVSVWEVSLLVAKGRIALGMELGPWLASGLRPPGYQAVALSAAAAQDSALLPGELHADPADRFLVATARELQATLVTADRRLLAYGAQGHLRVLAA